MAQAQEIYMKDKEKISEGGPLPEVLIFLHIPKAAGSTFYRILAHQYMPGTTFIIEGTGQIDSLTHFRNKSPEAKASFRFISGHMPFGIHTDIVAPSGYITMLRDPVERLLSLYYFIQKKPHHYLYDMVTREGMSLESLIEAELSSELTNAQTRLLAGEPYNSQIPCSEAMLERALNHIASHFIFTGLTERFDESLLLLKDTLQRPGLPFYVRQNVNIGRPVQTTLSEQTLGTIRSYNQYDLRLYQTIQAAFNQKVKDRGPAFQNRLKHFRTLNHLLQPFIRASWGLRHMALRNNPPCMS